MSTAESEKQQVAYVLPIGLIRWVRREAVREECWPAHVVAEALIAYRQKKADERRTSRAS